MALLKIQNLILTFLPKDKMKINADDILLLNYYYEGFNDILDEREDLIEFVRCIGNFFQILCEKNEKNFHENNKSEYPL